MWHVSKCYLCSALDECNTRNLVQSFLDQCKCLPFNIRLKETVCKFYYFNSSIPEIYICQDEVCITDEELNCTENVINQPPKSKCLEKVKE